MKRLHMLENLTVFTLEHTKHHTSDLNHSTPTAHDGVGQQWKGGIHAECEEPRNVGGLY